MMPMPKVMLPTMSGTFDPPGATIAYTVGRNAVIRVPRFWETAKAVTRVRVGNSSW
jgi:hypothetical protein